jgi:hypothetical protein
MVDERSKTDDDSDGREEMKKKNVL